MNWRKNEEVKNNGLESSKPANSQQLIDKEVQEDNDVGRVQTEEGFKYPTDTSRSVCLVISSSFFASSSWYNL